MLDRTSPAPRHGAPTGPREPCSGHPAVGPDRGLPELDLAPAWAPLPLHSQLQCLWRRGDRSPWSLARGLAHPAAPGPLPSLQPLRLRSGARLRSPPAPLPPFAPARCSPPRRCVSTPVSAAVSARASRSGSGLWIRRRTCSCLMWMGIRPCRPATACGCRCWPGPVDPLRPGLLRQGLHLHSPGWICRRCRPGSGGSGYRPGWLPTGRLPERQPRAGLPWETGLRWAIDVRRAAP